MTECSLCSLPSVGQCTSCTSLGNSAVIVIPKPVVDGFGLKMGDKLEVIANACGISIPLKEKKN